MRVGRLEWRVEGEDVHVALYHAHTTCVETATSAELSRPVRMPTSERWGEVLGSALQYVFEREEVEVSYTEEVAAWGAILRGAGRILHLGPPMERVRSIVDFNLPSS